MYDRKARSDHDIRDVHTKPLCLLQAPRHFDQITAHAQPEHNYSTLWPFEAHIITRMLQPWDCLWWMGEQCFCFGHFCAVCDSIKVLISLFFFRFVLNSIIYQPILIFFSWETRLFAFTSQRILEGLNSTFQKIDWNLGFWTTKTLVWSQLTFMNPQHKNCLGCLLMTKTGLHCMGPITNQPLAGWAHSFWTASHAQGCQPCFGDSQICTESSLIHVLCTLWTTTSSPVETLLAQFTTFFVLHADGPQQNKTDLDLTDWWFSNFLCAQRSHDVLYPCLLR